MHKVTIKNQSNEHVILEFITSKKPLAEARKRMEQLFKARHVIGYYVEHQLVA